MNVLIEMDKKVDVWLTGKIQFYYSFSGKSRSPSLVLSYLIKQKGMNFEQAYNFVKQKYSQVEPNKGFINQLKQYAEINKK